MVTRMYGLSGSGMDIDQLVKDLMKAQRTKYNTLAQKKTQLEWRKADYNTMYTALNDFRSNTVMNYKLQGTLMPRSVSSTDTTVATATANPDAVNFAHTLEVTTVAQSASMSSSQGISIGATPDRTNLNTQLGISGSITLSISDGTTTKALVNNADNTAYDTTGKTIYDVVSDINKLGLNVKANYDTTLDRFYLYSTKSGAASQITLTGDTTLTSALQLGTTATVTTDTSIVGSQPVNYTSGLDATFNLDGVTGLTQASNTFTLSGVTYNIQSKGKTTVSVGTDVDKIVSNVKSFIDSYNTMLGKLNTEVNEAYYRDYLPLTDDQKSAMKDTDITAWEAKAKSGLLHNDSILREAVGTMRSDVATPVAGLTGTYTSAASIGITSGYYQEGGKLYLNESKLRTALQSDPEIVNKIFGTSGGATRANNGIATRMYSTLKNASDKIVTAAGITASTTLDTSSMLALQIKDYTTRMSTMNTQLQATEDRYYTQFTAMETALSKLNQQSSWLSQQLGSS